MTEEIRKDILGRDIKVGDFVAVPHSNTMIVTQITKINPKMLRVHPVQGSGWRSKDGYLKYPKEVVLLDAPHVTMYILKSSK